MSEMISFGGGVNSVAMTIMLVNEGWRGPIVFADTGGEHPETYCYLEYFDRWLKERELEIVRISPAATPEYYCHDKRLLEYQTLEDFCIWRGIIPILSTRWCSVMFKGYALEAWRKQHDIAVSLQGICADEPRRVRADPMVQYPLVERDITRGECGRIIRRVELPVPIKSGCFFCPGQGLPKWHGLYHHHPDLYERAAQLERNAATRHQKWYTLDPHGQSLDQMRERRWQGQMEMDLSEWLPCICSL